MINMAKLHYREE